MVDDKAFNLQCNLAPTNELERPKGIQNFFRLRADVDLQSCNWKKYNTHC